MSIDRLFSQPSVWRVNIAGICALILTVGIARFAYTPLLPLMQMQANLSATAAGWLATINYTGYIAGAILASSRSELRIKYRLYRWGLVLAVMTTAATGLTTDIYLWTALRFLSGFSSTSGMLLASGLILNWLLRQGQRPDLGAHFLGMGLGIVVTGFCAVVFAGSLSWDRQWLAFAALSLTFFLPAWLWMPQPAPIVPSSGTVSVHRMRRTWLICLHLAYFCAGFSYVISATFIISIVQRVPTLTHIGNWIWLVVGVSAIPSSFLWDCAARRVGEIRALLFAYSLQIISVILPALSDGVLANMLGATLYGATFAGIVSLTLALIGRSFPNNPAKAMARLTLSYGVGLIVAPIIAGTLADMSGDFRSSLFMAAIVLLFGIAILGGLHFVTKGHQACFRQD